MPGLDFFLLHSVSNFSAQKATKITKEAAQSGQNPRSRGEQHARPGGLRSRERSLLIWEDLKNLVKPRN